MDERRYGLAGDCRRRSRSPSPRPSDGALRARLRRGLLCSRRMLLRPWTGSLRLRRGDEPASAAWDLADRAGDPHLRLPPGRVAGGVPGRRNPHHRPPILPGPTPLPLDARRHDGLRALGGGLPSLRPLPGGHARGLRDPVRGCCVLVRGIRSRQPRREGGAPWTGGTGWSAQMAARRGAGRRRRRGL
jgi:hypothetical protein